METHSSNQTTRTEGYQDFVDAVLGDHMTREDTQRGYSKWAERYESEMALNNYVPHQRVRRIMCERYPPSVRSTVKILDVAAGTGLVGQELKEAGFEHIDAIEPNTDMQAKAKERGIYENYHTLFITREELDIPKGSFDGLTACELYAKGEGHVPMEALYEMVRLVAPGGYIVIATTYNVFEIPQYRNIEDLMKTIQEEKKWRMVDRKVESEHVIGKDGIYWTFQVL